MEIEKSIHEGREKAAIIINGRYNRHKLEKDMGSGDIVGRSEDEDTDKDSITFNLIDVKNECSIQTPIAVLIIFMECKIHEFMLSNIMID